MVYHLHRVIHDELFDAEIAVLEATYLDYNSLYMHTLLSVRNSLCSDVLWYELQRSSDSNHLRTNKFVSLLGAMCAGRSSSDSGFTGGTLFGLTKMPHEIGKTGLPHRALTFYGRPSTETPINHLWELLWPSTEQVGPDPPDVVLKADFADYAPLEIAPECRSVPEDAQHMLAQDDLYCCDDDLGLRYWYSGDFIGVKQCIAPMQDLSQSLVLPQPFGDRIVLPYEVLAYLAARPRVIRIYVRPLRDDDVVVFPLSRVQDKSFEELRWLDIEGVLTSPKALEVRYYLNEQRRNVSKGYGESASLSLSDVRAAGAPPAGVAPRDGYRLSSSVKLSAEHPSPTPTPTPTPPAVADARARLTDEAVAPLAQRVMDWSASPRPAQQLPPGVQLPEDDF